jgi:3-phenylpropionate/trans-cinnamate dioxygenase ferredoxin subunit
VCKVADLIPDTGKVVLLGDNGGECAIFLHEGRCYAVGSVCPHQNASLDGAACAAATVICRRHGFRFNLKTGDCLTIGGYGLPTYPVELQGDEVIVSYWEYD